MLHSDSYRYFTSSLMTVARECCNGRIVFAHEGGYSKDYVPFCGLAVVEGTVYVIAVLIASIYLLLSVTSQH